MDSRSDRSTSPEPPHAARRRCRRRSSCPCCDTDGADRISGLPDKALLKILAGGLSRRWRGLWRRLPEIHLHGLAPDAVVAALAQVALPELSVLDINVPKRFKISAAGVASLLRTAARLAPVELTIIIWGDRKDTDIAVELPCFDRATYIWLELGDVKLAPPAAGGEFPLLERLSFAGCRLSTATLISQCLHLRALELRRSKHPDVLRVQSAKIEELVIDGDTSSWLGAVDIDAPLLKKFTMNTIIDRDFSMSFSAPMLEILSWHCRLSDSVGINGVWSLSNLKLSRRKSGYFLCLDLNIPHHKLYARKLQEIVQLPDISVFEIRLLLWGDVARKLHGPGFGSMVFNLLGMFTAIQSLKLETERIMLQCHTPYARKLQEIIQLPDISVFELRLLPSGHGFGSVVLNLLGMFTAIQSLKLDIGRIMIGYEACGPNCHCDHQQNWQSQNITLTDLKEAEIKNFGSSEDEVNLLKLVFGCAPLLKRVTLRVSPGISPRDLEWEKTPFQKKNGRKHAIFSRCALL